MNFQTESSNRFGSALIMNQSVIQKSTLVYTRAKVTRSVTLSRINWSEREKTLSGKKLFRKYKMNRKTNYRTTSKVNTKPFTCVEYNLNKKIN